jgi:hypothetical protein
MSCPEGAIERLTQHQMARLGPYHELIDPTAPASATWWLVSGIWPSVKGCIKAVPNICGSQDDLYHIAGHKGQARQGGPKLLGRRPRCRRKKCEPGRGHDDKDRPAIIAWVSRQGAVVIQATKDCTVQTVQKAADLAVQAGSRLSTDSASSYRAVKGYMHAFVNHTQKEYACGDVHENRAECLFSLLTAVCACVQYKMGVGL